VKNIVECLRVRNPETVFTKDPFNTGNGSKLALIFEIGFPSLALEKVGEITENEGLSRWTRNVGYGYSTVFSIYAIQHQCDSECR
jgi:hypothetical protein